MAESKHTKGPWSTRKGTTTGMEVFAPKPRGGDYTVARCGGKDREANAYLAAAAPDLLDAAHLCIAYDDLLRSFTGPVDSILADDNRRIDAAYDAWVSAVRDAVDKAEGRS